MARSLLSPDIDSKHRAALFEANPGSLETLITRTPKYNWMIHPAWLQRLEWAGLLPFARLVESTRAEGVSSKRLNYDQSLLTCLVDRWRPETHTFHFRWGEMAPTLEDVSYLLGLPLEGDPIGPLPEPPANWKLEMAQRFDGLLNGQSAFGSEDHGPKVSWLLNFEVSTYVLLFL